MSTKKDLKRKFLWQSCVVSEHGRKLLQLANSDTSFSFLHALLRQNEIVEEDKIVGGNTLLSKAIKHNLSSFEVTTLFSFSAVWSRTNLKIVVLHTYLHSILVFRDRLKNVRLLMHSYFFLLTFK